MLLRSTQRYTHLTNKAFLLKIYMFVEKEERKSKRR